MPTSNRSTPISLLPVLSVNFIGMLGYSIIMPFLVFLVNRFGGNEFIYGLLGATYPAFQFFGAPLLGRWSDRFGRRKILLLSQLGTFLAWVVFLIALYLPTDSLLRVDSTTLGSFAITLPLIFLLLARALDGLTGGNISVANAYLSDISTEETRKSNFAKMTISSNLGFVIGPALAGLLGATVLQETLPVLTAMLISTVALYLIWSHLPESKKDAQPLPALKLSIKKFFHQEHKECYELNSETKAKNSFKELLRLPSIPLILGIYFLTFLGFSLFYAAFPMHALHFLEWDSLSLGIFFSFLSGLMIVVEGPLLSLLSKRLSESQLIIVGGAILVGNFVVIGLGGKELVYMAGVLFALGNGLMWPSFLSLLSKTGGAAQQGAVQGIANSSGSLASIVGLVIGGYLYGTFGPATFLVTAVILAINWVLCLRLPR
mgnify:CR=1 FL=1